MGKKIKYVNPLILLPTVEVELVVMEVKLKEILEPFIAWPTIIFMLFQNS